MEIKNITTLAIESSCDETSVAVVKGKSVLSTFTHTQLEHSDFGGVVPEIASRKHAEFIELLYKKAISEAQIRCNNIDAVGATNCPGLLGSLLVGTMFAKGLAQVLKVPMIGINHVYAHIQAAFIENDIALPYLALVVSGGHTILLYTKDNINFEVIGTTRDDAAGEAFDKGAKILNLGYPGGPIIDKISAGVDPSKYSFTVALKVKNNFDFSFSGLKTQLLYFVRENKPDESEIKFVAASYQKAIVDSLMYKTQMAAKHYGVKNIVVSGGVSGNSSLRENLVDKFSKNYNILIPSIKYCTDNAAMVGISTNILFEQWKNSWNQNYSVESYPTVNFKKVWY